MAFEKVEMMSARSEPKKVNKTEKESFGKPCEILDKDETA